MTTKTKRMQFKRRLCSDGLANFAAGVELPGRKRIDPQTMSERDLIQARRLSKQSRVKQRNQQRAGEKRRQRLELTGAFTEGMARFARGVCMPGS